MNVNPDKDKFRPGPVAVIGAGTIGAGWAAFFALRGLVVRVVDPAPTAAASVARMLRRAHPVMQALGLVSPAATQPVVSAKLGAAMRDVVHVQEVLPEDLALKQRLYAEVEAAAPADAIIASSSSGLLPSRLQEGMRHPERLLVAHPCNPPYLMPLVELVAGQHTSTDVMAEAEAFYRALGKQTVRLRREIPGHLANRLQAALWREAVHLVAEGYASVRDVDRVITEGLGARWAVCGPHEIFHLSGGEEGMAGFLDRFEPAVSSWWADLGAPVLDGPTCQKLVAGMHEAAGGRRVSALVEERDRRLPPVLAAKSRSVLFKPSPAEERGAPPLPLPLAPPA
jgi:carnitine 3-dehydrogenase